MRQNKYRGLRVDNNEWVYGVPFYISGERKCFIIDNCQSGNLTQEDSVFQGKEVEYKSVSQFTGLKDKNGKEIFEDDVIRVIGFMKDGKYKFDCQYRVHKMDYEGIKLSFIKLTNELPDSIENSFPISQSPSFYYGSLTTDYRNDKQSSLAFKDTFGENTLSRTRWKEHDYTNDLEIIGNIHDGKEVEGE